MEYLYINNSYCTDFLDLKKLLSDSNNQKNKRFRNEVLAFFRDDVLEKWLMHHGIKENELHLPDKEGTDDVCFRSLVKAITGTQIDGDICSKFNEIGKLKHVECEGETYPVTDGNIVCLYTAANDKEISIKVVLTCLKPENNNFSLTLGDKICTKNWKNFNREQDVEYEFIVKRQKSYILKEGGNNQICEIRLGQEYVDLGLPSGLLWATCNVGASKPEEYGDYYEWGKIEKKEVYDSFSYESKEETNENMTTLGILSNGILTPSYDVAVQKIGKGWRMPTANEFNELINECSWEWISFEEVYGYKVISKKNKNSIFFPAAGFISGSQSSAKVGRYWSSSKYKETTSLAFIFSDLDYSMCAVFPTPGYSVRPVKKHK